MSLPNALDGLQKALDKLESSVESVAKGREGAGSGSEEVQRLNADRAELASKLDKAEERSVRLTELNREVARRLVAAMETIRTVLDRS